MRALLRSGMLWPCFLVGCSSTLASPESTAPAVPAAYRVDYIEAPDGVMAGDAADINEHGQIAGNASSATGIQDAYIWSATNGFALLPRVETAYYMECYAINESGVVAGNAWWEDGTSRPVIWTDATHLQDLGVSGTAYGINDRGHVVGTAGPDGVLGIGVAFMWDATNDVTSLSTLGDTWNLANGINATDDVVGTSELADGTSHAFLWSKGTMTDLGALNGIYSDASAISDAGVVTGTYQGPTDETRVYRWTDSEGMVDVGPTYPDATDGPTSLSTDVNASGQIVGGVEPPGLPVRAAVRQPTTGAWQELMPDWQFETFALAANNRGVIVGRVIQTADNDVRPSRAAVIAIIG